MCNFSKIGALEKSMSIDWDTSSSSTIVILLVPIFKSSFGTYNVICGPTKGQYFPKLKPFRKTNPYK